VARERVEAGGGESPTWSVVGNGFVWPSRTCHAVLFIQPCRYPQVVKERCKREVKGSVCVSVCVEGDESKWQVAWCFLETRRPSVDIVVASAWRAESRCMDESRTRLLWLPALYSSGHTHHRSTRLSFTHSLTHTLSPSPSLILDNMSSKAGKGGAKAKGESSSYGHPRSASLLP
jgi:hypothetical protein